MNEVSEKKRKYLSIEDIIGCISVTDRRTYKDRRDVWASEKKKSEFVAERPKAKIKHNTPPPEENPLRKNKSEGGSRSAKSEEEQQEDLVKPLIVFSLKEDTSCLVFV